jgi:hypothetical protein
MASPQQKITVFFIKIARTNGVWAGFVNLP